MKKLLAIILAGTMLFGLAACNKTEPTTDENKMPENMASMTDPIDALARCMLENGLEYDPQDPDFFWIALYYFTGGYGLNHPLIEEKEGTYQLQIPLLSWRNTQLRCLQITLVCLTCLLS